MGVIPVNANAYYQPYEALDTQITTKPAIAYPLIDSLGVSQGYHLFHPGVDIRAPRGSKITPVRGGIVKLVVSERWGYGNRIEIDHLDGHESLYAHLDEVFVEVGQKVDLETIVGTVGMTGRTTGPHLHLEVRDEGRLINPLTYLARK
jgi:murein DD-endopeptidase MepM/ murein hydrolase activator NlpD